MLQGLQLLYEVYARVPVCETILTKVSFSIYGFYSIIHNFSLKIEAITCNKLSHCLFDFDCPDFAAYENEKYEHSTFKF